MTSSPDITIRSVADSSTRMHSTGVGAGFPSVGVALAITFTDAGNIYLQRGLAAQVGGSVNVMGLSIGYDHSFFTNSETGAL